VGDCVPRDLHSNDANADLKNVIFDDRLFYYQWISEGGFKFYRGRAFLFHDTNHTNHALELAAVFCQLGYTTQLYNLDNIMSEIGK